MCIRINRASGTCKNYIWYNYSLRWFWTLFACQTAFLSIIRFLHFHCKRTVILATSTITRTWNNFLLEMTHLTRLCLSGFRSLLVDFLLIFYTSLTFRYFMFNGLVYLWLFLTLSSLDTFYGVTSYANPNQDQRYSPSFLGLLSLYSFQIPSLSPDSSPIPCTRVYFINILVRNKKRNGL